MQHHMARRMVLLILTAILLLSGCTGNTAVVLPPDSTADSILAATEPTTLPSVTKDTQHQHNYTQTVTDPTCTDMGYTTYSCDCGDSYTDSQIEALGHSYTVSTVAPTDSALGYDLHQCSRCGDSYQDNYIEPLVDASSDHTHSYTDTVISPTCTEKGYTKHVCSCGIHFVDSYSDALGHDLTATTVAPTTTSKGYDLHRCSRCSYNYKDNYTDPLPAETTPPATAPTEPAPTQHNHTYTKSVVAATCTEQGYALYTCACGESYRNSYTDPLGHDYKVSVVLPTVQEQGYNLHTCKRCGNTYKDTYVDKLPAHTDPPETQPPETEPPETEPKNDHPVYDISNHVVGSLEYEILAEINARREAEGLSALKMDTKLCALSTIRAYECTISFSHTRPNGSSCFTVLTEYNYRGSLVAENLLYASSGYSAARLVDVWMDSTSHRSNILHGSFTKAGIGIFYSGGRIYVANFFAA